SIGAGTVAIADFGNGTTASPLGVTALTDPTKLVLSAGATLEFNGSTNTSTARSFTVGGSAGIAATGTGTLEFTAASILATSGSAPALTLTASNTGTNRFAPTLADGSSPLATLAIDGTGTWVIGGGANGANRFKGDIRIDAGAGSTIGFESGSLPPTAVIAVADGAKIRWEPGNTTDLGGNLSIKAGDTAKLDLGNNTVVFNAAPTVATGGTGTSVNLEKQGSGTLKIATGVNASSFNVALPANSGLLSVNGTVGNVSLASGSKLGGSGTVGDVTAGTGAIVSPGNSPGVLGGSTIRLDGGSIFEWQVQDAKELTVNPGYDKLTLSGNLDLTHASAGNKITLKVVSLLGNGNGTDLGNPLNFDKPGTVGLRPMVFNFATVAGNVLTNSGEQISDVFTIDVSQFTYSDGSASSAGL
ncbi:MAG: hypothetical protein EBV31_09830, partial [Verrucomicrobia bacterium]|nr:hypothetical protein [Verrucomicrobiota bacterium]